MYIIAGLGNPGRKYEKTRHNCGFQTIDILAARHQINVTERRFRSLCGTGTIGSSKVLLVKPQTFMNLSGEAIREACAWYKICAEKELIVIYDDISLDTGRIRVRAKGSSGGHNGLKDIIMILGTDKFLRVKIGTGRGQEENNLTNWVLGHFTSEEMEVMSISFGRAAMAVEALIDEPLERVMNEYNRRQE